MKFKVGDRVQWAGITGTVVKDWKFKSENACSLEVEFDCRAFVTGPTQRNHRATFMYDGRLLPWHKEASLKLL